MIPDIAHTKEFSMKIISCLFIFLSLIICSCGGDDASETEDQVVTDDSNDEFKEARTICFQETNKYRKQVGVPALTYATDKNSCSDDEAKSDSESGTAHGAFGECSEWAQNECPGWPAPASGMVSSCLKMMFDEGPGEPYSAHGHYINMTSTKYTRVSCGFHVTDNGSVWLIQNFY